MSERKAIAAAVWSFFVPVVGLILGIIAYRKAETKEEKYISLGAIVNSVWSFIFLAGAGLFLYWFFNTEVWQVFVESQFK